MLKVLAAGWLIGASALVLTTAGTPRLSNARSQTTAKAPAKTLSHAPAIASSLTPRVTSAPAASGRGPLVPVLGVTTDQLRDTFTEPRGGNRVHRAMDILAPIGTPVVASVDGTIRKLFDSRAGGITIYQFDVAEETVYYYAHLDRYADGLREGLFVKQGTVIGYVGTTGNAGATPHLHFSIERLPPTKEWWKGDPVNPYPVLREAR